MQGTVLGTGHSELKGNSGVYNVKRLVCKPMIPIQGIFATVIEGYSKYM